MKKYWFLSIVFVSLSIFSQSKKIYLKEIAPKTPVGFYHLSMPDENEQNFINVIRQDAKGQMWFATRDGLIRYNGKKLYIYKTNSYQKNTIVNNNITALQFDNQGNMWVGTQKGICRYRPETDDFIPLAPERLENENITDIKIDKEGNLWISCFNTSRLYKYDFSSQKLSLIIDNNLFDKQRKIRFSFFLIASDNNIFLLDTARGFVIYNPETKQSKSIDVKIDKNDDNILTFNKLMFDKDDNRIVWLSTHLGQIIKYNLDTGQQVQLVYNKALTNHNLKCFNFELFEDEQKNIWITTWFYGTYKLLPNRKEFVHFLPDKDNSQTISNTVTTAIYQDKAGYMWFGTNAKGVDILKKNKKFFVYPSETNHDKSLPALHYLAVSKDKKNRIWMGAEGCLCYFDQNNLQGTLTEKRIIKDASRFFTIYNDATDHLWFGTENGVYKYDVDTEELKHFVHQKDDYQSIGSNYVNEINEDKQHNIWIGSGNNGVTKYDVANHKFYRFTADKNNPNSLSSAYVTKIFVDKNNTVWIGTNDGLNKFNPKAGNFTVYKNKIADTTTISASEINDICELDGYLWIATQSGGLNRFDPKTQDFKVYKKEAGLPSNIIRSVLTDSHHNLWLSTNKNIVKFNPKTEKFIVYTASDGLTNHQYILNLGWQDLQFYGNFAHKDKQGYLYFGGKSGLVFFHPDSLPQNTHRAPLYIEQIKVNGKLVRANANKLNLKPDENHLEFDFTLSNLIQPDKNRYAWQLKPYDTVWRHTGNQGKAEYFNLPPGTYSLYYKAANNDAYWTEAQEPLQITITPRFYQTGLFAILLISFLLLLVAVFWIYKWYIKRQLDIKRKKMRYSTSKLDHQKAEQINKRLLSLLQTEKIYLEPDINLHKLADKLQVKSNYLSQVINQFHKRNFYEFINTYRIEEAQKLLKETSLKIEAVAYDSGFNSLSTFNAVFKKIVGKTPSQYRKSR